MKETQHDPRTAKSYDELHHDPCTSIDYLGIHEEPYDEFYDPIENLDNGIDIVADVPIVPGGINPELMHARNLPELIPDFVLLDPEKVEAETVCTDDITEMEIDCILGETPHYWRYISSDAKDFAMFQAEVNSAVAAGDIDRLMEVLQVYSYQFEIAETLLNAIKDKNYKNAKNALESITHAA